jgi:hypothetical protein
MTMEKVQSGGGYEQAARKGRLYGAMNQAATAYSVALTTTYTGIVLSNPAGSKFNLEVKFAALALTVAPVAVASIMLFGGWLAAGITVHTTPLVPFNMGVGSTFLTVGLGSGLADAAATLVGTPTWMVPMAGGFTAAALDNPILPFDLKGSVTVYPGGYFGIGALTAVTGFGGIVWEEIVA